MSLHRIDQTCRRALVFTPMERDRTLVVEAAVLAEQLGYEAVLVPEGWGFDATIVLAEIALRTHRIRLATGIASIWGRSAGTLAMAAATLDDLSGGRAALGLGASTPILAERFHGVRFEQPANRLRDTAVAVRALLDGDRTPAASSGAGLRLGIAARPDLPIWIAALGPRAVAVATSLADGWFPAMIPADRMSAVVGDAASGAAGDPEVLCGPMAAVGVDAGPAVRQLLGWYLTGMGTFYGDVVAKQGFPAAVDGLRRANPRPAPGRLDWPVVADPLLAQFAAYGDGDDVASQVARWDALVDIVTVLVGPGSRESVLATVAAAAPPARTTGGPTLATTGASRAPSRPASDQQARRQ